MPSGGGEWPADKKESIIDDLTNKLMHAFSNHFEEGTRGKDPIIAITGSEFTILLNEILLESSSVDVKQGFLPLTTGRRTLKNGSFTNIMKTLSAISNTHPKSGGRVFVGIADSAQDVQRVKEIDDVEAVRYQSLQVVGITREAKYLEMDINKYWDSIMRKIQSCSDLPEQYRLDIIRNSRIAAEGTPSSKSDPKYVLILAAPPTHDPISYKNGYYERVGTSTERVSDLVNFGRRFG